MIKRWFSKQKNTVTFGGQTYEVKPLSMENSLSLMLLLSPYIALLEEKWPEFQAALQDTGGMRGGMLFAFFRTIREDMAMLPGDMTKAVALLVGCDSRELAQTATGEELVEALSALDRIHDLRGIYNAAKSLGLVARYKTPLAGDVS